MTHRNWMLVVLLVAPSAMAEVVQFQGHAIEVDATSASRPVVAMRGAAHAIPGQPGEIVGKTQACLARADSGMGVVSVDPAAGRLLAVGRATYSHGGQLRTIKARLAADAGASRLEIAFSGLAEVQGEGVEEAYLPLSHRDGSGWEDALAAVIGIERSLLACLQR